MNRAGDRTLARLLIVRLSALGDIVHTLPVAANASRAGIEVGWLVEKRLASVLEGNPAIAQLFVAETQRWRWNPIRPATRRGLKALSEKLRGFHPSVTVEAHGLWKSAFLARLAKAPVMGLRARDRRERFSGVWIDRPVALEPDAVHVVDQNLLFLKALGIPIVDPAPDARYLLEAPHAAAQAFLNRLPRPFAVYHPGAARAEKTWGEERFGELARSLEQRRDLTPVISWGPGDEDRRDRMAATMAQARVLPPLDLPGLAHVFARATLCVAGDTGPAHLADALGCPTLALFGPASRQRNLPERNRPYRGWAMRYDEAEVKSVAAKAIEILDGLKSHERNTET